MSKIELSAQQSLAQQHPSSDVENNMAAITGIRASVKIQELLGDDSITLGELTDILQTLSSRLDSTLQNRDADSSFNISRFKAAARAMRSAFSRLLLGQEPKGLGLIYLDETRSLKLRKVPQSKHLYWYLIHSNSNSDNTYLGRDSKDKRTQIERDFDIDLTDIAPHLPEPL